MAGPGRIVAVNLGSQTIELAEFRAAADGGLLLRHYTYRSVIGGNLPLRHGQITAALREMLREVGIKHGQANYCISSQSVFARFVRLPAVEEEKIERIIAFEAQQNVPFPIEEVVWDYQLVGGGADEQFEVVLVAIKADALEAINAAVEAAGLRPVVIGVTTMALYNAFRYSYSDVDVPVLLVDIGARTTDLLFMEPGKIFSRSVPIGGSAITSAIAKEFDESFDLAEARKLHAGFVGLGGAYAEPSQPDVARMSKIIRSSMTRLHAEIMRSISHYRTQQQGRTPERIYLCGGTSGTPFMQEFFQEKLELPIELFNPLRNVSLVPGADAAEAARSAHLLGELVGMALRAVSSCPMELNLRPDSVVRAQEIQRRRPFLITAAACLIAGILGWSAYYARGAAVLAEGKREIEAKLSALRRFQGQLDNVRKQAGILDQSASPLIDALSARSFWPEILEDLNARLPKENIWITELIPLSNGKPVTADAVQIPDAAEPIASPAAPVRLRAGAPAIDALLVRGLYLWNPRQQEVVVDYFKNLVGSPFFALDARNQQRVIKPTMPNNTEWAFPYELQLNLKQSLPLP